MNTWGKLLSQYPYILGIGFLFTYFSSFGQTFLISLYVPHIESWLGLSNTAMSGIYAIATIASAFSLPYMGGLFDRLSLGKYMTLILSGLVLALLTLAFSFHIIVVVLGLYFLRLFGQGLMSHTAVSTMSRYFEADRGKAIGITTLGHPFGEATLPVLITLSIAVFGWRQSLIANVGVVLLFLAPMIFFLYRKKKKKEESTTSGLKPLPSQIGLWDILRLKAFWVTAPAVFALGFTNTAIFFFQLKIGAAKGWSPTWVSSSLAAFAISSAVGMFLSGPWVDRFTAKRLFPFILIPYIVGVFVLLTTKAPIIYPVSLALMGFANGSGSTVKNALFAEVFGVETIGKVRSLFVTVMVLSTALGPMLFGVLVDAGYSFDQVFFRNAIGLLVVLVISFQVKGIGKRF